MDTPCHTACTLQREERATGIKKMVTELQPAPCQYVIDQLLPKAASSLFNSVALGAFVQNSVCNFITVRWAPTYILNSYQIQIKHADPHLPSSSPNYSKTEGVFPRAGSKAHGRRATFALITSDITFNGR